jgi:hypothetical protein
MSTNSMIRVLLEEVAQAEQDAQNPEDPPTCKPIDDTTEEAHFIVSYKREVNSIHNGKQFFSKLQIMTKWSVGMKVTCLLFGVVNAKLEQFVTPRLTIHDGQHNVRVLKLLTTLRTRALVFLPELEAMVKINSFSEPVWLVNLTQKLCQEFVALFDHLLVRSSLTDTEVVQHQKRIMHEKASMFAKSPYFLELGARFCDPVNFANGQFEANGMFDSDGLLE